MQNDSGERLQSHENGRAADLVLDQGTDLLVVWVPKVDRHECQPDRNDAKNQPTLIPTGSLSCHEPIKISRDQDKGSSLRRMARFRERQSQAYQDGVAIICFAVTSYTVWICRLAWLENRRILISPTDLVQHFSEMWAQCGVLRHAWYFLFCWQVLLARKSTKLDLSRMGLVEPLPREVYMIYYREFMNLYMIQYSSWICIWCTIVCSSICIRFNIVTWICTNM